MESPDIVVRLAGAADVDFALPIAAEMEASAKARGTGIAKRSPEMIKKKYWRASGSVYGYVI